jgi:phage tail-like protein
MPLPDFNSSVGHSFGVEYDGIMISAIQEVSGLKMEQDVIDHKFNTPDGKYGVSRLPGRQKPGEVTLTRGLTEDNSFEQWVATSRFGKMIEARKNGFVIVFDYEGNPIKRYAMKGAWPKTLEIGSMKAGDTSVHTEKLTITYEEVTVEGG